MSNCFYRKTRCANSEHWQNLVNDFPQTRFMMVKNNQYRTEIKDFKRLVGANNTIKVIWNNKKTILDLYIYDTQILLDLLSILFNNTYDIIYKDYYNILYDILRNYKK